MKPEQLLPFLSDGQRKALRWVKTQAAEDRLDGTIAHGLAVYSLREHGLTKKERHPGWTATVLTKRGKAVLALLDSA